MDQKSPREGHGVLGTVGLEDARFLILLPSPLGQVWGGGGSRNIGLLFTKGEGDVSCWPGCTLNL